MTDADAKKGMSLSDLPWYTVPAILLGTPLLVWILTLIAPGTFYDAWVWKYYWGPIKADAAGRVLFHNGVPAEPGYNVVNTITWAALMGVCVLGLSQLVDALKIRMNNTLIFGATAWVVTGAIWHVLEDTDLLLPPLQYFFITPPIYLLFGAFGVLGVLTGVYMERTAKAHGLDAGLQKLWLILSAGILLYTLAWAADWGQVVRFLDPLTVTLLAAVTYFSIRMRVARTGRIDSREVMFITSLWPFLMSLAYVAEFLEDEWSPHGEGLPSSVWMAPLLAGLTTLAVYGLAKWRLGKGSSEVARAFAAPINLLIIFSQMVDGYATSLGLDLAGYREKHVLSAYIIDSFREFAENIGWTFGAEHPTFLAFAPVKLLISLAVIYAIDIYSKEDVKKYPSLIGFVKFAIIMVGIGPGVRDFVRLGLGV